MAFTLDFFFMAAKKLSSRGGYIAPCSPQVAAIIESLGKEDGRAQLGPDNTPPPRYLVNLLVEQAAAAGHPDPTRAPIIQFDLVRMCVEDSAWDVRMSAAARIGAHTQPSWCNRLVLPNILSNYYHLVRSTPRTSCFSVWVGIRHVPPAAQPSAQPSAQLSALRKPRPEREAVEHGPVELGFNALVELACMDDVSVRKLDGDELAKHVAAHAACITTLRARADEAGGPAVSAGALYAVQTVPAATARLRPYFYLCRTTPELDEPGASERPATWLALARAPLRKRARPADKHEDGAKPAAAKRARTRRVHFAQ